MYHKQDDYTDIGIIIVLIVVFIVNVLYHIYNIFVTQPIVFLNSIIGEGGEYIYISIVFIIFAMIVIITFKNDIAYSKVKNYVSKNKKDIYRIRFLDKIQSFVAYVDEKDRINVKNAKGSKIFKRNDDYFVVKSIKNEFFKTIKNHMDGKKEILSIYDLKYNTDLERLDRAFKRISEGTMLK